MTTPAAPSANWIDLLGSGRTPPLLVILGGALLYATNTLLATTIAPSAIREFGGIAYITWLTAAYLASSIASASTGGLMSARIGARCSFIAACLVFCIGSLVCAGARGMAPLIIGRFIQGAGGGLLSALSYVLVRRTFPESIWARAFAAISGIWGVAVLLGPLVGGLFANAGRWRMAFVAVALFAAALAFATARVMEQDARSRSKAPSPFPFGQLSLMCLSIASICVAQVCKNEAARVALIVAALGAFALLCSLSRHTRNSLLPAGAFSMRSAVGLGLWMALLLSLANDPFSLYGPLFLQELHGLSPLSAGYMVALEAMSWTLGSLCVSGVSPQRRWMWLIAGPLIMGTGIGGIAWRMPSGTLMQLIVPIVCSGFGIGSCWSFIAQCVMQAATAEEAEVAASSVATVQLYGFAFGGAVAGLIANVVGYSSGLSIEATRTAAFWVPASFVSVTIAAALLAARLESHRFLRVRAAHQDGN
jgi:MFS family permease